MFVLSSIKFGKSLTLDSLYSFQLVILSYCCVLIYHQEPIYLGVVFYSSSLLFSFTQLISSKNYSQSHCLVWHLHFLSVVYHQLFYQYQGFFLIYYVYSLFSAISLTSIYSLFCSFCNTLKKISHRLVSRSDIFKKEYSTFHCVTPEMMRYIFFVKNIPSLLSSSSGSTLRNRICLRSLGSCNMRGDFFWLKKFLKLIRIEFFPSISHNGLDGSRV